MKILVGLISSSLLIIGCAEKKKSNNIVDDSYSETSHPIVRDFSLTKKCSDGTDVYRLSDGTYTTWDGTNSMWVPLSPNVSPNQYC